MEKVKNLSYRGMAIAHIGKENLIERAKSSLLKKKDGAKTVLEDNALLLLGVAFVGLMFVFGDEFLKDLFAKIKTKSGSWMGI